VIARPGDTADARSVIRSLREEHTKIDIARRRGGPSRHTAELVGGGHLHRCLHQQASQSIDRRRDCHGSKYRACMLPDNLRESALSSDDCPAVPA
jgi:hypothetical protein